MEKALRGEAGTVWVPLGGGSFLREAPTLTSTMIGLVLYHLIWNSASFPANFSGSLAPTPSRSLFSVSAILYFLSSTNEHMEASHLTTDLPVCTLLSENDDENVTQVTSEDSQETGGEGKRNTARQGTKLSKKMT